jgi:hypothetical protein
VAAHVPPLMHPAASSASASTVPATLSTRRRRPRREAAPVEPLVLVSTLAVSVSVVRVSSAGRRLLGKTAAPRPRISRSSTRRWRQSGQPAFRSRPHRGTTAAGTRSP